MNYNYTIQWTDNVSWTHGAHAVRFGADIHRDRFSQIGNQFPRSSPGFQNQVSSCVLWVTVKRPTSLRGHGAARLHQPAAGAGPQL